jgi:hypothetical protein
MNKREVREMQRGGKAAQTLRKVRYIDNLKIEYVNSPMGIIESTEQSVAVSKR